MSETINGTLSGTLHRVLDLVDTNVAGKRFDIESRLANGDLMYSSRAEQPKVIVTMKRVYIKREKGEEWLRWDWETRGLNMPHACGFSGIKLTSERAGEYYILEVE